ncbi:MAG: hypothetical protein ACMUIG_08220 [Thermoplasmatota archaeon]
MDVTKYRKTICALSLMLICFQSAVSAAGSPDTGDRKITDIRIYPEISDDSEINHRGDPVEVDGQTANRTIEVLSAMDLSGYLISGDGVIIDGSLTARMNTSGVLTRIGTVPEFCDDRAVTADNIATFGDEIFFIFSRDDGKDKIVSIVYSNDSGITWSDPVEVAAEECDGMITGLHIWNGDLFAFYTTIHEEKPDDNDHFVKSRPLNRWMDIGSSKEKKLVGGYAKEFSTMDVGNNLYVLLYRDIVKQGILFRFDGNDWIKYDKIIPSGSCESVSMVDVNITGSEGISIFIEESESQSYGKDYVRMITSVDDGNSWDESGIIRPVVSGASGIQTVSVSGVVHLFWANDTSIFHTSSSNHGIFWSDLEVLFGMDPNRTIVSFSAAVTAEDFILLGVADSESELSIIYSTDEGRTWLAWDDRLVIDDEGASLPVISRGEGLVSYFSSSMTMSDLVVRRIGSGWSNFSVEIPTMCVPALLQWNDIGINCITGENRSLFITLINGRTDAPVNDDTVSMNSDLLGRGDIQGRSFDRVLKIDEDWSGSIGPDPLTIRMEFHGLDRNMPGISKMAVNYTTGFPFVDDLDNDRNILISDLSEPNGSITLPPGSETGSMITKIIETEKGWPDILTLNMSVGNEEGVRAGLLDENGSPLPGFSMEEFDPVGKTDGKTYLSWEGRVLGDLDINISRLRIQLELSRDDEGEVPVIYDLGLEPNSPPKIDLIEYLPAPSLIRSESTEIRIRIHDDIDPVQCISPYMEYRGPEDEDWIRWDPCESVCQTDGFRFNFTTDENTDIGLWQFRARAVDSLGFSSEYHYPSDGLLVHNSIPKGPTISIRPENPTTVPDVTLEIISAAWDVDYPDMDLDYHVSWIRNGEVVLTESGMWNSTYVLPGGMTRKGDVWSASVTVSDEVDESDSVSFEFEISNTPPISTLDRDLIIETTEDRASGQYDLSEFFFDPDGDVLDYTIFGAGNVSSVRSGSMLHFIPDYDWYGEEMIHIRASDGIGSDYITVVVKVNEINDPPILNETGEVVLTTNRWNVVWFSAWDPFDGDRVYVSSDIAEVIPGIQYPDNYHFDFSGYIRLIPDETMVGDYEITVTAVDGRGGEATLKVPVTIVDDIGSRISVSILSPENRSIGYVEDKWNFTGQVDGDTARDGISLQLLWFINGNPSGTGVRLENVSLDEGANLIWLTVDTGDSVLRSSEIVVFVLPLNDTGDLVDDASGGEGGGPQTTDTLRDDNDRLYLNLFIGLLVVLLLGMLIIVSLVLYRIRSDSRSQFRKIRMYQPRPSLPKGDIYHGPVLPALPPYNGKRRK